MTQCFVLRFANKFAYSGQDCVLVFDSSFYGTDGVFDISSIEKLKIIRTKVIEVVGNTPIMIGRGDHADFSMVCFSKCEYIGKRTLDGSVLRVSKSDSLLMNYTSFFGCSSSLVDSTKRYISNVISESLTFFGSNNSFNRIMRGSGLIAENCNLNTFSRCICERDFFEYFRLFAHINPFENKQSYLC